MKPSDSMAVNHRYDESLENCVSNSTIAHELINFKKIFKGLI